MKISVIIPVFNAASYLADAIDSILGQDRDDFECIVVDDGSTDDSTHILKGYGDHRVKAVFLPVNCGIGMARNLALRLAKGDYIAIMDADDVALPQRLSSQTNFLDKHPQIDILGTRTIRVKETLDEIINKPDHPLNDGEIKARLVLMNGTAMVDPTSMMRKAFLDKHKISYACRNLDVDHEFWARCLAAGATFHTLESRLLYKRRHNENVTSIPDAEKAKSKLDLRRDILGLYFPRLTVEELHYLASIMTTGLKLTTKQAVIGIQCARKAVKENRSIYGESRKTLHSIVSRFALNTQKMLNLDNVKK